MGDILTESEIRKFRIIENGALGSYKPTSYDLRLGNCHYIFYGKSKPETKWTLTFIGSQDELQKRNEKFPKYRKPLDSGTMLTIPPYGSAIIELLEVVDTYNPAMQHKKLIVGRFDLKLSHVYQALISQQATQVEPFYKGHLYCFVHNLSNSSIHLEAGERIATIEFSFAGEHLSDNERETFIRNHINTATGKYKDKAYSTELGIEEVRWFHETNSLPSDCGLHRLLGSFEDKATDLSSTLSNQFFEFTSREETINKLVSQVERKSMEKRKSMELIASMIASLLSLATITTIWTFYQQLANVIAVQNAGLIATGLPPDATNQANPLIGVLIVSVLFILTGVCSFLTGTRFPRSSDKKRHSNGGSQNEQSSV